MEYAFGGVSSLARDSCLQVQTAQSHECLGEPCTQNFNVSGSDGQSALVVSQDSMVALGANARGRNSSDHLNRILRQSMVFFKWVRTFILLGFTVLLRPYEPMILRAVGSSVNAEPAARCPVLTGLSRPQAVALLAGVCARLLA